MNTFLYKFKRYDIQCFRYIRKHKIFHRRLLIRRKKLIFNYIQEAFEMTDRFYKYLGLYGTTKIIDHFINVFNVKFIFAGILSRNDIQLFAKYFNKLNWNDISYLASTVISSDIRIVKYLRKYSYIQYTDINSSLPIIKAHRCSFFVPYVTDISLKKYPNYMYKILDRDGGWFNDNHYKCRENMNLQHYRSYNN